MQVHVIVVAAGKGNRFGSELPKQFCMLGDMPVLMHTIVRLGRALPQAKIAIALHSDYIDYWLKVCEKHGFESPMVVAGGATRWESVKKALEVLNPADDDIVLVHDGVRPVVQRDMVQRLIDALGHAEAAIPSVGVSDSLRQLLPDGSSRSVDRSKLVAVQTPQAFRADKLLHAYQLPYQPAYTDDASVFESAGFGAPELVEGSPLNIKITHPRDIEVAAIFLGVK